MGEGLAAVRRVPWLWAGMGADAIGTVATWGCVQALVPVLVRNDLGGSAKTLGAVYAAGGVGAIAAALATGSRGRPRRPVTLLFVVLAGKVLAVGLFGFAMSAATAMVASFLMGALSTVGLVVWMTLIHERVQGDLLGRVNSIDWLVSTSLMPVALAVVGPLADAFGVRALLVVRGPEGPRSCSPSCSYRVSSQARSFGTGSSRRRFSRRCSACASTAATPAARSAPSAGSTNPAGRSC